MKFLYFYLNFKCLILIFLYQFDIRFMLCKVLRKTVSFEYEIKNGSLKIQFMLLKHGKR